MYSAEIRHCGQPVGDNMRETPNGTKPVKLIAAACNNMGIGLNGYLPWNLPNEFKYLLDTITKVSQPVIIESIFLMFSMVPPFVSYVCKNEEEILKLASTPPLNDEIESIWVLGGVESYKNMMQHPWCNHIYFTKILADFECDTFFPEFDKNVFKLKENYPGVPSGIQDENGVKYVFQVYQRDLKKAESIIMTVEHP
ncbi:hypothetical protein XELAEV_18019898mg [Xenopus laevis]|uniref:dihydrofolate reductase n=1 Tax=Xenopus laevis TaxID=8355 RepID=A0A974D644_XENLA|nr:hypothetical protein XELAEV_18019898mg [Xenopus laevis]